MTRKSTAIALALVCVAAIEISAQQPAGKPSQTPRRPPELFSPLDLGLLEPPDREAWQKPEQVMDALYIGEGTVVAELGAGGGWFTVRLARRVRPNGTVYAEDIQHLMIEVIQRRVQREGLNDIVKPVLGTGSDPLPGLPANSIDAVLIVDVFHEMTEPVALLRNVARVLKPQGRIGIIEYREGEGGPGPDPDQRVSPGAIVAAAKDAGLTIDRPEKFLPYQNFLIFKK